MKNNRKTIHEKYHKGTTHSQKIIKENNFTYRLLLKTLNPLIRADQKKILDIGCGAGTICFYLAGKGHLITGVDISKKAVTKCLKSAKDMGLKNTEFFVMNFPEEKILNKKYDLVILTEVIEHLDNDILALKEIYKLLKPQGKLVLSTPSINAPLTRLRLTKNFDKRVGHLRRYELEQLKKILKEQGFKVLKIRKTEGILRNFLFVNPYAGKLVRIINHIGSDFVTFLDNISLRLFGESNYIIVAEKTAK